MSSQDDPRIASLKQAVDGLLYPSESDEPFEVFSWPVTKEIASAREQILAHAGKSRTIMEVSTDSFFDALRGADDADRFEHLRQTIESRLPGVKIFRVGEGETEVDIYIIGRACDGNWTGLHTKSVET